MKKDEKHKLVNNPLYFSNRRVEALEKAFDLFMDTFSEYAEKYELTNEQIASFKQLILDAYTERKVNTYIEHKLFNINDYLNKSLNFALKRALDSDKKENITKVLYYNNKNRLISNEHY